MEEAMFHLGPNQREILRLLKRHPNMTEKEIASKIYHKQVKAGDNEYTQVSRSLRGLKKKGLVERTPIEVTWRLTGTVTPKKRTDKTCPKCGLVVDLCACAEETKEAQREKHH
jgi:DNA-binding MarR family transcriptional regulator